LPCWWRVTRYDPALRDERGAYRVDTWTSVSDVGPELTLNEYLDVEAGYLQAFRAFAEESGVVQLQIRELDIGEGAREGELVAVDAAGELVRRMLREELVCRLESPRNDFAIHVGFDLYMYIGSARPCRRAVRVATDSGLFVEPGWPSPQIADDS
jgi:hypothetical protein